MSLHEYHMSLKINGEDNPFYALIMAAMRQADDDNAERLKEAFPWVFKELNARYNAPGGVLNEDVNKWGRDVPPLPDSAYEFPGRDKK